MRFLVDANILIYTRDYRDRGKQTVATRWMSLLAEREAAVVNLQVLNEVCQVGLRKLVHLSAAEIRRWIEDLSAFGDTPIDIDVVKAAWPIHMRYRLSWFDCLILSSADRLGCSHVLTEDMGASRKIGSLLLVNPFTTHPGDVLIAS